MVPPYNASMPRRITRAAVRVLDGAAKLLLKPLDEPGTARTGRRGEEEAYFWLRKHGYTIVARNWRSPRRKGEADLIAWADGFLCIVEVKTRSTREVKPAEAAVDETKKDEMRGVAREYARRLPALPQFRYDVLSVYLDVDPPEITLFRSAFA